VRLKNRWVVLVLRIVLSAAMLAVLLWRVPDFEPSELVPDWEPMSAVWMLLAIGLTMGSIVLSAVRWDQVLHALDLRVPLKRLTSHYFAGQFVSNVLPTTIGGDVLRIARVSRDLGGHRSESVASVVIERLTGWLVLPLISVIGLVVNRGLLPDHGAATAALVINTLALVGLLGVLYLASHQKILGRFKEHQNWLQFLGSVHLGITNLRHATSPSARDAGGYAELAKHQVFREAPCSSHEGHCLHRLWPDHKPALAGRRNSAADTRASTRNSTCCGRELRRCSQSAGQAPGEGAAALDARCRGGGCGGRTGCTGAPTPCGRPRTGCT